MAKRAGGFYQVLINGVEMTVKGTVQTNLGTDKRTEFKSMNGQTLYNLEPQPPTVTVPIYLDGAMSRQELTELKEATIIVNKGFESQFVLNEAFFVAEGDDDSEDGVMECKFSGDSARETEQG